MLLNEKRWKYIYESRINNSFINGEIDKEILLIYWFGFALKK